jgi:hypothetical protein
MCIRGDDYRYNCSDRLAVRAQLRTDERYQRMPVGFDSKPTNLAVKFREKAGGLIEGVLRPAT